MSEFNKIYRNAELSKSHSNDGIRYIIIEESTSGHCCFGYTIVDTKAGKETIGTYIGWKRVMCETFEKEEAIEICTALNKHYC